MATKNRNTSTPHPTPAYLLEIVRSDPFARFLQRYRISPIGLGLIALLYGFIRALALPALFGNLYTVQTDGQTIIGALNDWPILIIELVMVPVVAGYYLWQPVTMQTLYDGISKIVGPNPLARAKTMEYVRPLRWAGWAVIACSIGIFEALYIHYVIQEGNVINWETINSTMTVAYLVERFFIFYMLVFVIIRQIFMIIALNRFFSETTVKITPLHPDRAGGLHILGEYVLSTGIFLGAIGLYFGMSILRQEWIPSLITIEFYILMAIYFFLAPMFFLLPLIQAHRRMKDAKRKLLIEIAGQFDIEYQKMMTGLKKDHLESDAALRVETIHKIYTLAENAPEWPFSLEIVSKFGAATVLPVLIPVIVEVVRDWVIR